MTMSSNASFQEAPKKRKKKKKEEKHKYLKKPKIKNKIIIEPDLYRKPHKWDLVCQRLLANPTL